MTLEDGNSLGAVLPNTQPMESEYNFYLLAADMFRNGYVQHEVRFTTLALQVAPAGVDTLPLWSSIVKGLTDLALYDDAYATLMHNPSETQFVLQFT